MVIGVDGGALSTQDPRLHVGVWRVTNALLRELSKIDTINQYRIYGFSKTSVNAQESVSPRMEYRLLRPARGWFSLRLPLELILHPVDCYLALSQSVPLGVTSKVLGFVYDINFLKHPEWYPGSSARLASQTNGVMQKSNKLITISESVKKQLVETYKVPEASVTVCYPGVEPVFTHEGKKHNGNNPYFLFVGALKPSKQIPKLLEHFHTFLQQTKKPYDLYLVGGDYWLDTDISDSIERLGLRERVKVCGVLSDATLAEYYRGAVSFVAVSEAEGFCLPAVEAMACGCPVVTTDAPVFKEIVGDSGIQVSVQKSNEYSRVLLRIVSDSKLRTNLQLSGIKKAKKYTWSQFAQRIYEVISTLD